jgi:hypothetical protein
MDVLDRLFDVAGVKVNPDPGRGGVPLVGDGGNAYDGPRSDAGLEPALDLRPVNQGREA